MKILSTYLFIITSIIIFSCNSNQNEVVIINCDLETISDDGKSFISNNNIEYYLDNAKSKNNEVFFSGKNSIKLSGDNQYGLTFIIEDVKAEEYVHISAWRKSNNKKGLIIISSDDSKAFYFQGDRIVDTKDGWDLIELETFLPPIMEGKNLKVYVWNPTNEEIYFDDFKFEKFPLKQYPSYDKNKTFAIKIDTSNFEKLKYLRLKAFEEGFLQSENQEYVKIKINFEGEKYKAFGRFKGDWLDHLLGDKWSFRIKIRKGAFWKNLRTFSIQSPASRDYLNEWVAHKLFEQEDLLTTRYGFIPVSINDESKGVYAYEEHFEKQLLESKNRREGPILKLDEEFFWEIQKEIFENKKEPNLPFYYVSDILPFVAAKTFNSKVLYNEFLNGQTLLNQYKNGQKKASEVFDIIKMAKTYAIYDITRFYHGLAWHNLRFYYNPILCKLELISFDGYTEIGPFDWVVKPYLGQIISNDIKKPHEVFSMQCFNDSAFVENYYKYLKLYSSEEYLKKFFDEINEELVENENLIKKEFKSYKYNYNFILNNAKRIRESINNSDKKVFNIIKIGNVECDTVVDNKFYTYMIKAFTEDSTQNTLIIKLMNYLPYDVSFTGVETTDGKKTKIKNTLLTKFEKNRVKSLNIEIPKNSKKIIINNDIIIDIKNWNSPAKQTARDIYIENSNYTKYFKNTSDNKLVYNKKYKVIDELIYIPEGKIVIFNAGTEIDFVKSAGFVSCSPVLINGEANNPVKIISSDKSAQGFSIIAANKKSEFNYVEFDGLNTLNYHGWVLTGAVNFYESEVEIKNCSFINNNCEDALNIIRSNFIVENCLFKNIYGDAFDSDFSSGIANKCKFENTNNDAIDFSGSIVTISNCEMRKIADKAVSGGEKSKLTINNIYVDGANFGLVSKDLSVLEVDGANINNCQYAFLQLVKKSEYGPSKINSKNTKINKCKNDYLIEKDCILNLNGNIIDGTLKKLAVEFYK